MMAGDRTLTPRLDGALWRIGPNPDLGELGDERQQVVDHAIFQSAEGKWRLWACIRATKIGRLLYHWEGDALTQPEWRPVGVAMRADRSLGESVNEADGKEWIQAPHVIHHDGLYWMFYGGHAAGKPGISQICLATSKDGVTFGRRLNAQGQSRLFVGPGEARDPMVIRIGGLWHCYYCGHEGEGKEAVGKVYVRTSDDLLNWSEERAVAWGGAPGAGRYSTECPFVVERDGWLYLFRTSRYREPAETWVYRSDDPLNFCHDDDAKQVAFLRVAAPEVVEHNGEWFISSVEDLHGGVDLTRLAWDPV